MVTTTAAIVRYRCEQFPQLKVRIGSEMLDELEQITYAEFRGGVLDLSADDPSYATTVAALERARKGGTPIALIGDPTEDEDTLGRLTCQEFRCGHISRNEKSKEAHRAMHIRQTQVAREAPDQSEAD